MIAVIGDVRCRGEGGARACIEDHPMRSDITITAIARGARSARAV